MSAANRRLSLCVIAAGLALATAPPAIALGCLDDQAHLFGDGVQENVQAAIEGIQRKYGVEVQIVTLPELPPELEKQAKAGTDNARLIAQLTQREVDDRHAQGILILVCKNPPRVSVLVLPGALECGYSKHDGDQLAKRLRRAFGRSQYDNGIERGVASIKDDLETSALGQRWLWYVGIIGGVIVLWLVLITIRGYTAAAIRRTTAPIAFTSVEARNAVTAAPSGSPSTERWLFDDPAATR